MTLINQTRKTILATDLRVADTSLLRMRGLLGKHNLPDGEALMIAPCSSVHMMFMRFPIDVIFLDKNDQAIGLCHNLKPYQFSPIFFKSHCAIELPAGKIMATQTGLGDKVKID